MIICFLCATAPKPVKSAGIPGAGAHMNVTTRMLNKGNHL